MAKLLRDKFPHSFGVLDEYNLTEDNLNNYEYIVKDIQILDIGGKNSSAKIYDPMSFYKSFNPEFKLMSELNPSIPEFKTLLCQFIKDLLILYETGSYPKVFQKTKTKILTQKIANINKSLRNSTVWNNTASLKSKHTKYTKLLSNSESNLNVKKFPELYFNSINSNPINTSIGNTKLNSMKILEYIEHTISENYKYLDIIICYVLFIHLFSFRSYLYIPEGKLKAFLQNPKPQNNNKKSPNIIETGTNCYKEYNTIFKLLKTPFIIYPSFSMPNYYKTIQLIRAPIINIVCSNNPSLTHLKLYNPCKQITHDIYFHAGITHDYYSSIIDFKKDEFIDKFENNNKVLGNLLPLIKDNNQLCKLLFTILHEAALSEIVEFENRLSSSIIKSFPSTFTIFEIINKIIVNNPPYKLKNKEISPEKLYNDVAQRLKNEIPEHELDGITYLELTEKLLNELNEIIQKNNLISKQNT